MSPWIRRFLLWHRMVGLAVAAILIILAITGVLLNHADDLRLHQRWITHPAILDWYQIPTSDHPPLSFKVGESWVSQLEEHIYFNETFLRHSDSIFLGAVAYEEGWLYALNNQLYLYTAEARLIEQVDLTLEFSQPIEKIGTNSENQLIVMVAQNSWIADDELLGWWPYLENDVSWARPVSLPNRLQSRLVQLHRQRQLSYEDLILDLHNAQVLGPIGKWLLDILALSLLLLATSGPYIWWHAIRKNRSRRRTVRRTNRS